MAAVDVFNGLIDTDFQDFDLEDLEKMPSDFPTMNDFQLLCSPQDPLDDIEWYPSFTDDFISLNDVGLKSPEYEVDKTSSVSSSSFASPHSPLTTEKQDQKTSQSESKRIGLEEEADHNFVGFATKKARTKRKNNIKWANLKRDQRKWCSHCQTEKTPQWRIGPLGPRTLCNACGVRFKSGRLVPEYRPAASPTFDSCRHSNFHKKIMKKRI
ncbi:GATA transcription factor [Quillaja saponaria]|uniref:GATA transcription factor n=1 Tax=Quillaja saponaria TaxID=32244 RepID=A0AAD7LF75_QUISA|nr:GATA transcription factor [Quillaja saponaria]